MSRVRTPGATSAGRGYGIAKPDRAQDPDRLRADIDAGADLAELWCGLKNLGGYAKFGEGRCCC